jgi:hypothetical protein
MKQRLSQIIVLLAVCTLVSSCSTPTLVGIARRRQATPEDLRNNNNVEADVRVKYNVTDWDVLNFTDEVKRRVGLGATYAFGMGQIFQSRAKAQAYEQSYTQIQAAEATYYFHQLGMSFDKSTGKVVPGNPMGKDDIPSQTNLTPDGETLYYRTTKILKVLADTLAGIIPNLEDLKEAYGQSSSLGTAALPLDARTVGIASSASPKSNPPTGNASPESTGSGQRKSAGPSQSGAAAGVSDDPKSILLRFGWPNGTANEQNIARLKDWMAGKGLGSVDVDTLVQAKQYSQDRLDAIRSLRLSQTYIRDSSGVILQQYCWPGGVKNEQNSAALQTWMNNNALGAVDLVVFIHGSDYATQRQDAVRHLHLTDSGPQDAAAIWLQQYCWPGGGKNDQNLAALRLWMDNNSLSSVDPVVFIHSALYAAQRKDAVNALHLSNSYTRDTWGVKLQNYCWPAGKENRQNMDNLRQWMNSHGLSDCDFNSFIHGEQYASHRQDAVAFLHL